MTKYEICADGETTIAEIVALEESELEKRLVSSERRADDLAGVLRDVDAQLGLALLRLGKLERNLRAERVAESVRRRGLRRVRPWLF